MAEMTEGKGKHLEHCNQQKFENTENIYMHKPETVQENDTCESLWYIEIKTDPSFQKRRLELSFNQ